MGMVVIVSIHILLAVGFMLYFFHVPSSSGIQPGGNVTEVVPENNKMLHANITDTNNNNAEPEKQAAIVNASKFAPDDHDKVEDHDKEDQKKLDDETDEEDGEPIIDSKDSDSSLLNNDSEEKSLLNEKVENESNDKPEVDET